MHGFMSTLTTPTKEYGYITAITPEEVEALGHIKKYDQPWKNLECEWDAPAPVDFPHYWMITRAVRRPLISPDDKDWKLVPYGAIQDESMEFTDDGGKTWRACDSGVGVKACYHFEVVNAIRRPRKKPATPATAGQWVSVKERTVPNGGKAWRLRNGEVNLVWTSSIFGEDLWMPAQIPAPPAPEKELWEVVHETFLLKLRAAGSYNTAGMYDGESSKEVFKTAFNLGRESKGDK